MNIWWVLSLDGDLGAASLLTRFQERIGLQSESQVNSYGCSVIWKSLARRIIANANEPFEVETSDHRLNHQVLSNKRIRQICWSGPDLTERDMRSWYVANSGLVMAWIVDRDYEYWQNASDPLQYEAAKRDHQHLPKISNGLPFPLEQMIIDISANPGRRVIREGYIEAVGAVMDLGYRFWALTGANLDQVRRLALKCIGDSSSIVQVTFTNSPFRSVESDVELQARIRATLYPSTFN